MKFSIITPSLNQAAYLPACADSVLHQSGDLLLQWLVIDGGSNDGSVEILQSINDPRLRFTSETDRGQSDAINKGLARASGAIMGWLNSDDLYAPGALQEVARAFDEQPGKNWLIGRCQIIDEQGRIIRRMVTGYKNHRLANYRYKRLLLENFISQPAVFWRKSFVEKVGTLDESLHYTMDYDWWLRMGAIEDPIVLPRTLALFRVHGSSKTVREKRRQFEEDYRVACRYIGKNRWMCFRKRLHVERIVWAYRLMRWMGQ